MKLTQSLSPQDALIGFSENDHCLRKQNADLMLNWLDALPIVRVDNRKRRHRKQKKGEIGDFFSLEWVYKRVGWSHQGLLNVEPARSIGD